ncbi:hypothetical protein [Chitinivibrio alkaliphilus]|uniref:Uncharacterized protein n=1 Tax=Chitinivibrio alkaliphilus ACht1 TaxID=1313304 RepID=U7DBT8_9BACT|nr:hypothetical protein [Chitinivibrio alkaliphilus]ERP39048.1 hypothetical protein CALK_0542 [Chitinivibrio alkaliphilus ACht1]
MDTAFFTALFVCAGCSLDVAGGTGTETTNGVVVVAADGETPVPGAVVHEVIRADWYSAFSTEESPIHREYITDEAGMFYYDTTIPPATYTIFADEGGYRTNNFIPDTVILSSYVSCTLFVDPGSRLGIAGTALYQESKGMVVFGTLPPGGYTFVVAPRGGDPVFADFSILSLDTSFAASPSYSGLLFEDFTGGFLQNPLGEVTQGVFWYSFSDSLNKSYTASGWRVDSLSPVRGNSRVDAQISDGILHTEVFLGTEAEGAYGGVGAALFSEAGRGFTLTHMDTLVVRARGGGRMRISFHSEDMKGKFFHPLELTADWEERHLALSDFSFSNDADAGKSWDEISRNIGYVEMFFLEEDQPADSAYFFEIDTIFFSGVALPL